MSLENQILEILEGGKPLKAKDIAYQIGITPKEVNSLLYGRLQGRVIQDTKYQWTLKSDSSKEVIKPKPLAEKKNNSLSKLASYYLECVSKDLDTGISEWASSKYGAPDYFQTPKLPDEESNLELDSSEISHLIQKLRKERMGLNVSIGYPVFLHEQISKKGYPYYTVKPVLIHRIDTAEFIKGVLELTDDATFINPEASSIQEGSVGSERLQDIIQLNEELGLDNAESPSLEEIALKLQGIRSNWQWVEDIDPYELSKTDLSSTKKGGIYNVCAVFLSEKSKYTAGLEKELTNLTQIDEYDYSETILGKLINQEIKDTQPIDKVLIEPLPMNEEQRDAIVHGLQNELTVVTGPPGTGKSQVVSSLVVNAVHDGQKVLFASKNNKAVDVVLERVNGLSNKPVMLRLGNSERQDELSQYLTGILSTKISTSDEQNFKLANENHIKLSAKIEEISRRQDHTMKVRNEVDEFEQGVEELRLSLGNDLFNEFRKISDQRLQASEKIANELSIDCTKATRAKASLFEKLFWFIFKESKQKALHDSIARNSGTFELFHVDIPGFEADSINNKTFELIQRLKLRFEDVQKIIAYENKLNELQQLESIFDLSIKENAVVEEICDNSSKLWQLWLHLLASRLTQEERKLIGDYITVLDLIIQADKDNRKAAKGIWPKYYKLLPKITNILSCWAVTSLSVRNKVPFEPCFFDLVIIDEASQCDIASTLPLLYRAKRAVIIGDDKQLTHISTINKVQDNQLLEKYELIDDFMVWSYASASLFRLAVSLCRQSDVVQLKDHHRSHADIISYSNKHFYDGSLRIATNYEKLKSIPNEAAIRWNDIRGSVVKPASGGSLNEIEANKVVEELRRLVETGYEGTIGVVSPFRAQANRIKDIVFKDAALSENLLNRDFLVDTVHKFQGDERDVMIFSSVVSKGMSEGSEIFLSRTGNLFNVAITRARAALIVVGDQNACHSSSIKHFSQFADHVKSLDNGSAKEVIKEDYDYGPKFPKVSSGDVVSDWEKLLYEALYKKGIRTIPQYKVDKYSLDLALIDGDRRLDIEVDGETYHRSWNGELLRRDKLRNKRLIELGWDVQRLWVYEIRDNMQNCIERIENWLKQIEEEIE